MKKIHIDFVIMTIKSEEMRVIIGNKKNFMIIRSRMIHTTTLPDILPVDFHTVLHGKRWGLSHGRSLMTMTKAMRNPFWKIQIFHFKLIRRNL